MTEKSDEITAAFEEYGFLRDRADEAYQLWDGGRVIVTAMRTAVRAQGAMHGGRAPEWLTGAVEQAFEDQRRAYDAADAAYTEAFTAYQKLLRAKLEKLEGQDQ